MSPGTTLLLEAQRPRLSWSGTVPADAGPRRVPLLLPTAIPAGRRTATLQTPAGTTREIPGTSNPI